MGTRFSHLQLAKKYRNQLIGKLGAFVGILSYLSSSACCLEVWIQVFSVQVRFGSFCRSKLFSRRNKTSKTHETFDSTKKKNSRSLISTCWDCMPATLQRWINPATSGLFLALFMVIWCFRTEKSEAFATSRFYCFYHKLPKCLMSLKSIKTKLVA